MGILSFNKTFYMKKLLCLLTLMMVLKSQAQKNKKDTTETTHFYFGLGGNFQSFSGLNNRLASRPEYQKVEGNQAAFVFGWQSMYHNQWIVDYAMSYGNTLSGDKERKSSNLDAVSFSVNLGYNVLAKTNPRIRLFPFIGVSGDRVSARLNKDISALPFDSVLASTSFQQRTQSLKFSNTFLSFNGGIGVDFVNKKYPNRGLGVVVGYTSSFKERDWRANDDQLLTNAPKDKLGRFYFRVILKMIRVYKPKK
jgi:hypothetical protein